MAAPNIVNVSTITGKTAYIAVTTSAQDFLVNAAASGKVPELRRGLQPKHRCRGGRFGTSYRKESAKVR